MQNEPELTTSTKVGGAPPRRGKTSPIKIILAIVGVLSLVGVLVGVKACQFGSLMAMGKEFEKSGPPPETIGTGTAKDQTWEGTLSAVGSVTSLKGVSLSNDAAGLVTRISFDSGAVVRQGQVLVELDTSVERAQLSSAKARYDLALTTVERTRSLVKTKSIAQAQLDTDEAQLRATQTEMDTIQAQIGRKVLKAPFAGRLGMRNVNLGQYLSPGTPVTVLEAIAAVYVDFSLPQQRLGDVAVGMPVRMAASGESTDAGTSWEGTITAVDPTVDPGTRAIKLRAGVSNKADKLRPGMFLNVSVVLPEKKSVVIVPQTAVVHASYGDSVFIVENKKADAPGAQKTPDGQPIKSARQQFVRTGEAQGDFISILEGVKPGQELVTAGAFKLRNGSPVVVNNSVQPKAELNPTPENH